MATTLVASEPARLTTSRVISSTRRGFFLPPPRLCKGKAVAGVPGRDTARWVPSRHGRAGGGRRAPSRSGSCLFPLQMQRQAGGSVGCPTAQAVAHLFAFGLQQSEEGAVSNTQLSRTAQHQARWEQVRQPRGLDTFLSRNPDPGALGAGLWCHP